MKSNIIESNNETFTIGDYNGVSIIIRNKDNYINATKIAKDNGKQKHLSRFIESEKWNEICGAFENSLPQKRGNEKITLFYILREGYSIDTRGTYVHPKLIHFVAEWCNIIYAFKVAMIMDNINELKEVKNINGEENLKEIIDDLKYKIKKAEEEKAELKEAVKIKDDKIDELTRKIDEIIEQNKKQYKKLDKQDYKITSLKQDVKILKGDVKTLNKTIDSHKGRLTGQSVKNSHIILFCFDPEKELLNKSNKYNDLTYKGDINIRRTQPIYLKQPYKSIYEEGENNKYYIRHICIPEAIKQNKDILFKVVNNYDYLKDYIICYNNTRIKFNYDKYLRDEFGENYKKKRTILLFNKIKDLINDFIDSYNYEVDKATNHKNTEETTEEDEQESGEYEEVDNNSYSD